MTNCVVTVLPVVSNGDCTITIQSQCSHNAASVTDGMGVLQCMLWFRCDVKFGALSYELYVYDLCCLFPIQSVRFEDGTDINTYFTRQFIKLMCKPNSRAHICKWPLMCIHNDHKITLKSLPSLNHTIQTVAKWLVSIYLKCLMNGLQFLNPSITCIWVYIFMNVRQQYYYCKYVHHWHT